MARLAREVQAIQRDREAIRIGSDWDEVWHPRSSPHGRFVAVGFLQTFLLVGKKSTHLGVCGLAKILPSTLTAGIAAPDGGPGCALFPRPLVYC